MNTIQYLKEDTIVRSIKQHVTAHVTNTILERYKYLLENKTFILDPVVFETRGEVNGKIEFILEDGSSVLITKHSFEIIYEQLKEQQEVVAYMSKSADNFLEIVREL